MAIRRGPGSRHDPPPWRRRTRAPGVPPFEQFILLSMLLHALAVLLFGAPSGGSSEGRAMWGSLQVVLRSAAPEAAPPAVLKLDREIPKLTPRPRPVPPPAPAPPEEVRQPSPSDAPVSVPQLLDRLRAPELKLALPPEFLVPPPTPAPIAPAPAPPVAKPAPPPPEPTPKVEAVTVPAPIVPVPPAPVAPILPALPPVERAPPVELRTLPTPTITPPIARPPVEVPALPAPTITPPVARPPVELPALPVMPVERIAPPRLDPVLPPLERAPELPPALKDLPAVERATPPAPPPAAPAAPTSPQRSFPGPTDSAPLPSPFRPPPPKAEDFPSGSTQYDPTAPQLDADALRKRAGQLSREGTGQRSLFATPLPPPRKSKLETSIEKARKPDCKDAYKDLGLLAAIPLIANEFGEGNCRW